MTRLFEIPRATRLTGEVRLPGDKSISHRTLLLGALADGPCRVRHLGRGWDIAATVGVLRALGVEVAYHGETEARIHGPGGPSRLQEPSRILNCLNSGTTTRLLAGVLAGAPVYSVLTGDESLRSRPMRRIVEPLRAMGASIDGREGGARLPLAIRGRERLQTIDWTLEVASAQAKSALLLAGLSADGETTVREPRPTRDHTERLLRLMDIPVRSDGGAHTIPGGIIPRPFDLVIPGDPSSAAFIAVAACCLPGSQVAFRDLALNPCRIAYLDILRRMGANIGVGPSPNDDWEPRGDVTVGAAALRGITIEPEEVPALIDELPVLAVAMAVAEGPSEVRGASELRRKESDRIAGMASELRGFGVEITELEDGFRIAGGKRLTAPAVSDAHGDHRLAMSLAVAGLVADGTTRLRGAEHIDVSFPDFERLIRTLAR
ncbi:MAG TPA: 3-phosphoshikimate 1-carboxyvinyltransferase [Candidatus Ozemobacteraceae bacterium]|nr:3-phosphoshikimate 1-carboxyvinyltransferase [Candidatus Ozemobacteraceae bacterium]